MGNENGEWIMRGLSRDDPRCLHTPEELIRAVDEIGFLPLFQNEVPGFSVEERTSPLGWWTGDESADPWEWRRLLADSGRVAYGKFFHRKAGFVSLQWLPDFINWRRDGYDFDSLWEDEKAPFRQKKIMDVMDAAPECFSFELRRKAGFGGEGEKNFEGVITDLMMETYLTVRDFRCRRNKQGLPYGWHVAVYTTPEALWGAAFVADAYQKKPRESRAAIFAQLRRCFPAASEGLLEKALGQGVRNG